MFRNDMKGTLYLSHRVVTILFHCYPRKSVISEEPKMKDKSHVDIHDFNVSTLFKIEDISPSAYAAFIYNSYWLVGMVSLVNIAVGDVINIDFMHPHGPRKIFN